MLSSVHLNARGQRMEYAGRAQISSFGTALPASRVQTPPRSSMEAPAASARQETAASSGMGTSAFRSVRRPTTRGASASPARRWIQVPRSGGTGSAAAARKSTSAPRAGTGRSARHAPRTPPGTRWRAPVSAAAGRDWSESGANASRQTPSVRRTPNSLITSACPVGGERWSGTGSASATRSTS